MKKIKLRDKLSNQKKIYKILITIIVIGVVAGFIFVFLLNKENKNILKESLNTFFISIKDNTYNTSNNLKNTILSNLILCFIIWFLGISIIGIPVIILILLYKGFILGFSFSSIIAVYGLKGIIPAIIYIIPYSLIILITSILLGFYAIKFSARLFKYLFFKKNINLSLFMTRYLKILCISLISYILSSLYSVYILPNILKLFTFILF